MASLTDQTLGAAPNEQTSHSGRLVLLFAAGAMTGVPLLDYTVTGLSVLCLLIVPGLLLYRPSIPVGLPIAAGVLAVVAYAVSAWLNSVEEYHPTQIVYASIVLYIAACALCCRNIRDLVVLLVGVSVGTIVFNVVVGTPLAGTGQFGDLWKYGIASAVTVLVVFCAIAMRVGPTAIGLWLAGLAVVSLALNYRSHALVCVIAAVLVVAGARLTPVRAIVTGGAAVAGFGILLPLVAGTGWFGSALESKVSSQSDEGVPTILAGRTEPPLSFTAIAERPLLGWGSADQVPGRVFAEARLLAVDWGFSPNFPFVYTWGTPENGASFHSILLGSWAEAGIVAVLFPVWLLVMCVLTALWCRRVGVWAPLVCVVALQAAWDLVFSPWTYNLPAVFAVAAALCIVTVRYRHLPETDPWRG